MTKIQPEILNSCSLQHEKMCYKIHWFSTWGGIEIPFTSLGKCVSVASLQWPVIRLFVQPHSLSLSSAYILETVLRLSQEPSMHHGHEVFTLAHMYTYNLLQLAWGPAPWMGLHCFPSQLLYSTAFCHIDIPSVLVND